MIDYQTINNRQKLLDQFDQLLTELTPNYPLKKLGKYIYILGPHKDSEKVSLTLTGIIHGNEPVGLLTILQFLQFLKNFKPALDYSIGLALGNYEAFLADKRFLETDLNRSFNSSKVESLEQKRALELSSLLGITELLVDYHQTIQPSHYPFFIFPYTKKGLALAQELASDIPVIVHWGKKFSKDGMCTDEYVISKGGTGITVETGHRGTNPLQSSLGFSFILHLFSSRKKLSSEGLENRFEQIKDETLFLYTWSEVFAWPGEHYVKLKPDLHNFSYICKNEVLGSYDNKQILTHNNGHLLFPKYVNKGEPHPKELFRLVKRISLKDLPDSN